MSDNLRRYRAIRRALTQCYPGEISGRMAQHVTTLAALISGIVGSRSSQMPSIAMKIPDRAKLESRVKRLSRWLDNDAIKEEIYFLPYAEMLLNCLALETLVLVMDGSGVGRGCSALMIHVIYKGRALPLAWVVRQSVSKKVAEATFREDCPLMNALIFLKKRFRKMGQFRAIRDFFDTLLSNVENHVLWAWSEIIGYASRKFSARSTDSALGQE